LRLFVGVFPPSSALADLRRGLPPKARLTPIDRWHLTLVFLGEVPEEHLPEVSAALAGVSSPRGIRLRLAGGGEFKNARSAALWAGVQGDLVKLSRLQQDLQAALAKASLSSDNRPYRPHLTVSYRDSEDVRNALEAYAGPSWSVDEYVLVRSHHEDGGGYDQLNSWPC
jgi:2'-5' RNA ligase